MAIGNTCGYTSETLLNQPVPPHWPGRVLLVFRLTYYRWCLAGSALMAAALGFYSLMCFMPLGMFLVWSVGMAVGGKNMVLAELRDALKTISPGVADGLTKQVAEALQGADPSLTGILGLLALVWAGHRLFEILEVSLTRVWHGRPVRGFLMRKLLAFAMLVAAAALLGTYMLFVSAVGTVRSMLLASDPALGSVALRLWEPLTRGLAAALVFLAFFLIYRYIPRERVPGRVAVLGAVVATVLWEAVAAGFGHWIGRRTSYQTLYGSMANVVLFGLWAYASGIIVLVSAALSASYFQVFGSPAVAAETLGETLQTEDPSQSPASGGSREAERRER